MENLEARRARRPLRQAHARDQSLVVVSNRLPFTIRRGSRGLEAQPSAGGLVSALEPALRKRGGLWIGWPGIELKPEETLSAGEVPYEVRSVPLSREDVDGYYYGFSNATLWPLFHSLVERTRFERTDWEAYERVNARFAEVTAGAAADAGLVWVHDYHLLRAPLHLRNVAHEARIGFFLHVPFPSLDIFRLLPWAREILLGLLACDVIGFHVKNYADNFLDCVERLLGVRIDHQTRQAEHGGRSVRVAAFPLGIDFDLYEERALAAPAAPARRQERVVLGVDRLDYTKGIPERIRTFERLLELFPEYRGTVILLQIAVPSRFEVTEYRRLKRQLDELVGRVNGRFATADWSPIHYLFRSVPAEELAALYRDADVALLTPLRDGMNLVAKEFVASQVAEPGVLLLSRLTGAAETMHEAIAVNPYNLDGTAESLHRALTMQETERRSRLAALRRRERRDNLFAWLDHFLQVALESPSALRPPSDRDFESWLGPFLGGYRLALFLDYDGTLAGICDHPAKAVLAPEMRRVLEACAARSDNDVAIVSGRSLADLRSIVGQSGLTYAGNHGLETAGPDIPDFLHEDVRHYESRTAALAETLTELAPPGAWAELKGPTLTFHYRNVDASLRDRLVDGAREIIGKAGFLVRDVRCAVEALPPIGWHKGNAILHILRSRYGPSWSERVRVVYVGDDVTDEDAFRLLAGLGVTFRVGTSGTLTSASRGLANTDAVCALLDWLSRRPMQEPKK